MKNKTKFMIFHGMMIVFYIYMYMTSITKWFNHKTGGVILTIFIVLIGVLFREALFSKFKHYFDFKTGHITFKVFKISVLLMMGHFVISVTTGVLMGLGINSYKFHRLSLYVVPVLVLFHLISRIIYKRKLSMR